MKKLLIAAFVLFQFRSGMTQDSLQMKLRAEFFPVFSGVHQSLGEGISIEIQREFTKTAALGISYNKSIFDQSTSRDLELVFYNQSNLNNKLRASVGLGFFARYWSNRTQSIPDGPVHNRGYYTAGYVVSLGVNGRLSDHVGISTRINFNNNTDAIVTYSLRQGILIIF